MGFVDREWKVDDEEEDQEDEKQEEAKTGRAGKRKKLSEHILAGQNQKSFGWQQHYCISLQGLKKVAIQNQGGYLALKTKSN